MDYLQTHHEGCTVAGPRPGLQSRSDRAGGVICTHVGTGGASILSRGSVNMAGGPCPPH